MQQADMCNRITCWSVDVMGITGPRGCCRAAGGIMGFGAEMKQESLTDILKIFFIIQKPLKRYKFQTSNKIC